VGGEEIVLDGRSWCSVIARSATWWRTRRSCRARTVARSRRHPGRGGDDDDRAARPAGPPRAAAARLAAAQEGRRL